jgi:hypothetical protein
VCVCVCVCVSVSVLIGFLVILAWHVCWEILRVAADVLNKQLQTADMTCSFRLRLGQKVNSHSLKKNCHVTQGLSLGYIL